MNVVRTGTVTTLILSPGTRTLLVDETAGLTLNDDYGLNVAGATWVSSDPSVVSLSTDDPPVVTALAAGSSTITATKNGLSATATLTVVAGTSLADGTTRWSVAPTPGLEMISPIYTHVVDETVPDLFTVETDPVTNDMTMRALEASGTMQWLVAAPGTPLMGGDSFGGVVAHTPDVDGTPAGLARFAGPVDAMPWRYEPAGAVARPAQAPDGTIYAIEATWSAGNPFADLSAVVITGNTGRLVARVPLPRGFVAFTAEWQGQTVNGISCNSGFGEEPLRVTDPVVGTDGAGYFQVRRTTRVDHGYCDQPDISRTDDHSVQLVKVTPSGAATFTTLYEFTGASNPWWPETGQTVPDGLGGILTTWSRHRTSPAEEEWMATRFDEAGVRVDSVIASDTYIHAIGQAGIAYVSSQSGAQAAIDLSTWETKWTAPVTGTVIAATPAGGAILQDTITGDLHAIDATGVLEATHPLGVIGVVQESGGWLGATISNGLSLLAGVIDDATRWAEPSGGNRQGERRLRNPGVGIFAKSHFVPGPFSAQHVSIRITPTNIGYWRGIMPTEFLPQDQYGNHFMTFGAGTPEGDSSLSCSAC